MEICHVSPFTELRQRYPELFGGSSKVIVRNTDALNFKFLKKLSETGKEVILWYDTLVEDKQTIVNLTTKIGCHKVIYPIATAEELQILENTPIVNHLKFIVTITTPTSEKDYFLVLERVLKSRKTAGVGFDWMYMMAPFRNCSSTPFAMRARVLSRADLLFGLALYDKEYYCLKSSGSLAEIMLLNDFRFINVLATDAALRLAAVGIKVDDENRLPTDFDLKFVQEHSIDTFGEIFDVSVWERELAEYNIKVIQKHNDGDKTWTKPNLKNT